MKVELRLAGRNLDELCEMIESKDLSLQAVAEAWGCTKCQLQAWIAANPIRAERAREARESAADWCDREAERVLQALTANSTVSEVARARELASHYRWRAKVRNPLKYGERVSLDHRIVTDASRLSDNELATIAAGGLVIEGLAEIIIRPPDTDDEGEARKRLVRDTSKLN